MSRVQEAIKLLHDMRKTHRMQPLGWGRMIEESFTKLFGLLESEPESEPTEFTKEAIQLLNKLKVSVSMVDADNETYITGINIREARHIIALLESNPEPMEFTKIRRSKYDAEIEETNRLYDKDIAGIRRTNIKIKYEWDIKACDIIDRLNVR